MIKRISNFKRIKLKENSIVLCDIDDTLLNFEHFIGDYWNTSNKVDHTYDIWFSLIENQIPLISHASFYTFLDEIHRTNSKLILITARSEKFKNGTLHHLKTVDIIFHDIHFLNGNLKGDFISKFYSKDIHEFSDIHFIDDDICQVFDVKEKNANINVYHFCKN